MQEKFEPLAYQRELMDLIEKNYSNGQRMQMFVRCRRPGMKFVESRIKQGFIPQQVELPK